MPLSLFLLLSLRCFSAPLQLTPSSHSVIFSGLGTPISIAATSDLLFRCTYNPSYSLFSWVKFGLLPSAAQVFITVTNGAEAILQVYKLPDGSYKAVAMTNNCGATVTVSVAGPTSPMWAYVAVGVCSVGSPRVVVGVTMWQGASTSAYIDSVDKFADFDASRSQIILGGLAGSIINVNPTQGQLLNTQFDCGQCRPLSDMTTIVSSTTCYGQCVGGCSGPGDKSCNDYIQLTDEVNPTAVTASTYFSWGRTDPHLQEHSFSSPNYSFTGWYYETDNSRTWENLFRAQTVAGNFGVPGQRAMTIFRNSAPYLHNRVDGTVIVNQGLDSATMPILATQPTFLNNWMFVTVAVCNGSVNACYAILPSVAVTCKTAVVAGGTITFGATTDSKLFIGDQYYGGIAGKLADHRYYLSDCKSFTDFNSLYVGRKTYCMDGCTTCTGPFECSVCIAGYYLNTGVCKLCNSCCVACSGAGNASCLTCSSFCTLIAPNTCVSNCYADCPPMSLTCNGPKAWNCVTCAGSLMMQPMNSGLCLASCPSGYAPVSGICVGSDQVILDYQFDKIASVTDGINGQKGVNGATLSYFPPTFEASDPIPCKRRGYYFAGSQYVQLPPAASTSGSPTVLPTTLTFTAWIRPQGTGIRTLYAKKEGCIEIFTIRLTATHSIEFVTGYPTTKYAHIAVITLDVWTYVALVFQFSSTTGLTTVTYYYNGAAHATTYSAEFYIKDTSVTALQTVGASTAMSDYYRGFLWRVKIQNYAVTAFASEFSSAGCPAGLSFCLSPSAFAQTPEGLACSASCANGCVRATDCSFCQDVLCEECSEFFTTPCARCIANAVYTSQCDCVFGRYFKSATRTCEVCPISCNGCSSPSLCLACYSNAWLSSGACLCNAGYYPSPDPSNCLVCPSVCLTCSSASICLTCKANAHLVSPNCVCDSAFFGSPSSCQPCGSHCAQCASPACVVCAAGYYLLAGVCLMVCPSGYSQSGTQCVGGNQVVLDFTFDVITPTITGISGVTGLNGASVGYFPPSFESSDPIPSKHRGYYFAGNQYIQLPPATGTTGPALVVSPWCSFMAWIRPQGAGTRTIYSKSFGGASLFTIRVNPANSIEFVGGSPGTVLSSAYSLTADVWVFIGLTFDFDLASGVTTVKMYYDGVQDASVYTANCIISDGSTTAAQYVGTAGSIVDAFFGFIWRVKMGNFLSTDVTTDIASASCPVSLSFCLSPCPFSQTPDCQLCQSTCPNGCVRPTDCSLCFAELCEECSEFETTGCSRCIANTDTAPQCQCVFGRFFDRISRVCKLCSAECNGCLDGSNCIGCFAPAVLRSSACVCPDTHYPDPNAGHCSLCSSYCLTCKSASMCLTCKRNSHLQSPDCLCDQSFFGPPDNCQQCSPVCLECANSPSYCTKCTANAQLLGATCNCIPGFYPNPDASRCDACSANCLTCDRRDNCLTCVDNSTVVIGRCECVDGFYGDPPNCVSCGFGCKQCRTECDQCYAGFYRLYGKCYLSCPKGFKESGWDCFPASQGNLTAAMNVDQGNDLILNFSARLAADLTSTDIGTVITTLDGLNIDAMHSIAAVTPQHSYNVSVSVSSDLSHEVDIMLKFLNRSSVRDEQGNSLTTANLTAVLSFSSKPDNSSSNSTQISPTAAAAVQGTLATAVVAGMVSGSPTALFNMMNNIQLLSYLPLSGVPISKDLRQLLMALNMQSMFPNPFSYIFDREKGEKPPSFAVDFGYDSSLFFANSGLMVSVGCFVAIYALISKLLIRCPVSFFAAYFKKVLTSNGISLFLRYWIQVYLDASIAAFLQLSYVSEYTDIVQWSD